MNAGLCCRRFPLDDGDPFVQYFRPNSSTRVPCFISEIVDLTTLRGTITVRDDTYPVVLLLDGFDAPDLDTGLGAQGLAYLKASVCPSALEPRRVYVQASGVRRFGTISCSVFKKKRSKTSINTVMASLCSGYAIRDFVRIGTRIVGQADSFDEKAVISFGQKPKKSRTQKPHHSKHERKSISATSGRNPPLHLVLHQTVPATSV
eukprot:m.115606 g.115606  ORF g.115606 m.115606 type:complete len:205 (-) comp22992_c0_seq1:236-850(-)